MEFPEDSVSLASDVMDKIRPDLTKKFVTVVKYLMFDPQSAPNTTKKNPPLGSYKYFESLAITYCKGQENVRPNKESRTIPDELVSIVLHNYFEIPESRLEDVKKEHRLSMAVENFIGKILEHYVSHKLEQNGWVWASGSVIKSVDFIKEPDLTIKEWRLLQLKNRSNSENSSSSKVRQGTTIEKWFRSHSTKNETNWASFPDESSKGGLSEEDFRIYVLRSLKRE
jgi:hypothetical protein